MSSSPQASIHDPERLSQESMDSKSDKLEPIQREVIALFVNGVRVLGLPKSVGEIYGLLSCVHYRTSLTRRDFLLMDDVNFPQSLTEALLSLMDVREVNF